MRKTYPYLNNGYETVNEQVVRREFLSKIDNFVNQKRYVKMTLLNWQEEPLKEIEGDISSGNMTLDGSEPLKEIEGDISSGNMTLDGSSSVRRTCTLTAAVDAGSYDVEDAEMDFSIDKKIFIEVGIKNYTDEYPEYPILWFPQGVFFIRDFGCNSSTSSALNITLTRERVPR